MRRPHLVPLVLLLGYGSLRAQPIPPEKALSKGWAPEGKRLSFTPEWFAHRYDLAVDGLDQQRLSTPAGAVDVCGIRVSDRAKRAKLWSALERDRSPNERIAETDDGVLFFVTSKPELLARTADLAEARSFSSGPSPFDWLLTEIPEDISGLQVENWFFLPDLPAEEKKVAALPLVAVYHCAFHAKGASLNRRLSQVTFWVPRDHRALGALAIELQKRATLEETVLRSRRAVAVLLSRNEPGKAALLDALRKRDYRPLSGAEPAVSPAP
jgi:hypothetical protein